MMSHAKSELEARKRDRCVERLILIEGTANLVVLAAKVTVGLATGSLAVLGDAIHSLSDMVNNLVAFWVVRLSRQPADREHPYGHRKFETLGVFGLATLLAVMAFELALRALQRDQAEIAAEGWALALMAAVLGVNIAVAGWQRYWARRLKSEILLADATHTFGDVLTTVAVIVGWQISARGYPWVDTLCALGVAGLVAYLAFGLYRRALPALVDEIAVAPEAVSEVAAAVPGVRRVIRVRSRWIGDAPAIDLVITVDPALPTSDSHAIADNIEQALESQFQTRDISIHIEPDGSGT